MLSVEGTFRNGVVQISQPIAGRDGQKVLIMFLQEDNETAIADSAWSDFAQILKDCQVNTGILDLAHVLLEVADALAVPNLRPTTIQFINRLRQAPILRIIPVSENLLAEGWTLYGQRLDKD